jgi:hypothetical protein
MVDGIINLLIEENLDDQKWLTNKSE